MSKEKEEDQVFYVGMKDPVEIRRSILESSKEMLQYMQRAEKFKEVRKEKEENVAKLKETMKEIASLIRKLKTDIPKTQLREGKPKKKHRSKAPKAEPEKQPEKPAEISELEKLESELGEIESRLTNLS